MNKINANIIKNITKSLIIPCCVLFLSISCRAQIKFEKIIPKDNTFTNNKYPTNKQLENYRLAAKYSKKNNGKALIVIKGYDILFEEYHNGHSAEMPNHIWSGTKGFTSAMTMCAIEDGFIDLDEKISDTLPEFWKDPKKSKITVRELLNFTSGLKQDRFILTFDMVKKNQRVRDKYQYALDLPAVEYPGVSFNYGGTHHYVLGAFLQKKLGQNPLKYMQKKIFDPIGFRYSGWHKDPEGNPALPFGCWTTAREWGKFGILMRDNGQWKEKQVISSHILRQCTTPNQLMPAFGFGFWLNQKVPFKYRKNLIPQLKFAAFLGRALYPRGPKDLFVAAGHNGNRCYIIPSQDLVIIRFGSGSSRNFDINFLKRILDGRTF